jgi:hypothetical protein
MYVYHGILSYFNLLKKYSWCVLTILLLLPVVPDRSPRIGSETYMGQLRQILHGQLFLLMLFFLLQCWSGAPEYQYQACGIPLNLI